MENWAHNKTDESLEEREQLLRLILENAPVGIITVEPDGQIHSVNPYLCQLLGYSSEEFLTMQFAEVVHPEDQAQGDPLADQLLAGEIHQYNLEVRLIHRDGRWLTGDLYVNLVLDSLGEPLPVIRECGAG